MSGAGTTGRIGAGGTSIRLGGASRNCAPQCVQLSTCGSGVLTRMVVLQPGQVTWPAIMMNWAPCDGGTNAVHGTMDFIIVAKLTFQRFRSCADCNPVVCASIGFQ